MRATVQEAAGAPRSAVIQDRDLHAIIFELREELDVWRRVRDEADAARQQYEQQTGQLRSAIAAMREALEQAKLDAERDRHSARAAAEGEIRDLKQAVAAGREALDQFRAGASAELDKAVSGRLVEIRQL